MPRFFDVGEYKLWARNSIPTDDNVMIEDAILTAEQSLDNALGRRVDLASHDEDDATVRLFRPYRNCLDLFVNDCTAVTAVSEVFSTDTVVVEETFRQLEPLNGLSPSGEQMPYDSIRCLFRPWWWNGGLATVSVTALWGWPQIPALVKESVKVLTKAVLDGRDVTGGIIGFSPEGNPVSPRDAKIVKATISDYSLRHSLVGGSR